MSSDVPRIYSPRANRARLTILGRLAAMGLSAGCLALLVTAVYLTPSPTGMGTHRALGLAACHFAQVTGLPCPTCGMTTSFAWFVRGKVAASVYVQPMGAVLALLAAGVFWAGLYAAITGRAVQRLIVFIPARYYVTPLLGWALLAWAWKMFIHVHGVDGWHG